MRTSKLKAARLYQEMVLRWLRVRRDYLHNNEPRPEPPAILAGAEAQALFDACERDFNRSTK
jgi:hypothetical protein